MNQSILFSVIIPSYNRGLLISKTIASFLAQSYPSFELIIVDDGSSDNTRDVIEGIKDSRVRYYYKENGERGAARNFGAFKARGEYLNFFDSDDLAYPHHLETAHQVIAKNGQPLVFHLGSEMRDEKGNLLFQHEKINGSGAQRLLKVNYVNPNPVFVHRSTLEKVTVSEDRRLSATEDWLYHLQLAARFDFIAYDDTVTSCMIQHDQRSMNVYNGDAVLLRTKLLVESLQKDGIFMQKFGSGISSVKAEMYGLAALQYSLQGKRIRALKSLITSIRNAPALLFKRRTLAVFKYLLIRSE